MIFGIYLLTGFLVALGVRIWEREKMPLSSLLYCVLLYPIALPYALVLAVTKVGEWIHNKLGKISI